MPKRLHRQSSKQQTPPVFLSNEVMTDGVHLKSDVDAVLSGHPDVHLTEFGQLLVRKYLRTVREEAGCLDRLVERMKTTDNLYRAASVRSALSRPWLRLLLLAGTIVMLYGLVVHLTQPARSFTSKSFRLVSLKERSGTPSTAPGVASFGLMMDGCDIAETSREQLYDGIIHRTGGGSAASRRQFERDMSRSSPDRMQTKTTWTVEGNVMTLTVSNPVSANGWFFQPLNGNQSYRHPVLFRIEAEEDGEWVQIGAPAVAKLDNHMIMQPIDSNVFDARPIWLSSFTFITKSLGFSVSFFSALALAVIGRPQHAEWALFSWLALICVLCAFSLAFALSNDALPSEAFDRKETAKDSFATLFYCVAAIVVYMTHWRYVFHVLFAWGVSTIFAAIVYQVWPSRPSRPSPPIEWHKILPPELVSICFPCLPALSSPSLA